MYVYGLKMETLKHWLWPFQKGEAKKLLMMMLLFVCLMVPYAFLKDIKDVLVINELGPMWIPNLKVWVSYGLYIFAISHFLSHRYQKGLSIVLSFYLFVLPSPFLSPSINVKMFYLFASWWPTIFINLLFWQFFNAALTLNEWKRFYPWVILIGNITMMISASIVALLMAPSFLSYEMSLKVIYLISCISILGAMYTYWYLNKHYKADQEVKEAFVQSIKTIAISKEFWLLGVMVLCGSIVLALGDMQFKAYLRNAFSGNHEGYREFMRYFYFYFGLAGLLTPFLVMYTIKHWSWRTQGLFAPLCALCLLGSFYLPMFNVTASLMFLTRVLFMSFSV